MELINNVPDQLFTPSVIVAHEITLTDSPLELRSEIEQLLLDRKDSDLAPSLKEGVRGLLRRGGFKPSGRSKPASEYLLQSAKEGRFPWINNIVDINNFISMKYGLPISALDLMIVGDSVQFRYGKAGEKYIFNQAGHEIELENLLCVGRADPDEPLGNPVKDSMTGKLKATTNSVLIAIYSSTEVYSNETLGKIAREFSDLMVKYAHAKIAYII
jgi:DNA/RNA-binding domain of Phe-tRNA-synthetase-like protein